MPKTLFEKIWDSHVVDSKDASPDILYIDTHLVHEVTSPQAFQGLRQRGMKVMRPEKTFATMDHNVPTKNQNLPIKDALSRLQVEQLEKNCKEFGVQLYGLGHPFQGIVHVIGPELGITQPGKTMVCGDSHTSTHGAFGAVAFGIGTSEVEEVLATQCLLQNKPKKMKIEVDGKLGKGVVAKDIILYIISRLTAGGGTGYFVEFAGSAIRSLSMEGRMTICNMSIEMGARGGLIAPDDTTFEYVKGKLFSPKGEEWEKALAYWKTLHSDDDALFDKIYRFKAEDIEPMITYGTNPGMGVGITATIPKGSDIVQKNERESFYKSLRYMGYEDGTPMLGKPVDYVFIGSCTNSRIEDLRMVAEFIKGRKTSPKVSTWVIPGSKQVEAQAKKEGLDKIFEEAGIEFREPGCSACLAMNDDKIPTGKYCVSTSNRNFEGRQGPGARTLLASPLTAAATAIKGEVADIREFL
jgi:3-isopropylmalate/(R)-2-methylmalate dehydratase large subunit